MKRLNGGVFVKVVVAVCIGISGAASATGIHVDLEASSTSKQANDQFKQDALKFVQEAQTYLAVTNLQWQNYMFNPGGKSVDDIFRANSDIKEKVAAHFERLMSSPEKTDAIATKLKDYYAAWDGAFDGMRPISSEGSRSYAARVNGEMSRMDSAAARIKLDIKY